MVTKNILLIGKNRSGKSTLANVLYNKEENFRIGKEFKSFFEENETKKIQTLNVRIGNHDFKIIDTIGVGNTKLTDEEIVSKINEVWNKLEGELTQVLFVIGNRITLKEIEFYKIIKHKILDKKFVDYVTIVRTNYPYFRDEDKKTQDKERLKKMEAKRLSPKKKETARTKLISSCIQEGRFFYVDNPSLDPSDFPDDRERNLNKQYRKLSRITLSEHLKNVCQKNNYKLKELESIDKSLTANIEQIGNICRQM